MTAYTNKFHAICAVIALIAMVLCGCGGGGGGGMTGGGNGMTGGGDGMTGGGDGMTGGGDGMTGGGDGMTGGGDGMTGGGDGMTGGGMGDWAVNPQNARTLVGGTVPEDLNSDTIRNLLESLSEFPDYLWDSPTQADNVWFDSSLAELQPVMTVNGINVFQGRFGTGTADPPLSDLPYELYGYGAWLDYSWFILTSNRVDPADFRNASSYYFKDYAYGCQPCDLTADPLSFPVGAQWSGVMIGQDKALSSDNFVQGEAQLTATSSNSGGATLSVEFSEIVNLSTGQRYSDITWPNFPIDSARFNNGFEKDTQHGSFAIVGPGDYLRVTFTGPNGEEVVGSFQRDLLEGFYGAKR